MSDLFYVLHAFCLFVCIIAICFLFEFFHLHREVLCTLLEIATDRLPTMSPFQTFQTRGRMSSRAAHAHDHTHHPADCTCDKWNEHLRRIKELTKTSPAAAIRALHATLDPSTRDPDLMPSLRCELYIMLSAYSTERPVHCLAEAASAMEEWQANCDLLPANLRFPVQKHIIQMKRRMKEAQDVVDSRAHFDMMAKTHSETPLTGPGFVEEIDTSDDEAEEGLAAPLTAGRTVGVGLGGPTETEQDPMPEDVEGITRFVLEQMMHHQSLLGTLGGLNTTRNENSNNAVGRGVGEGNRRERRAKAKAEKKAAKLKR